MKSSLFEVLTASLREGGRILSGEAAPSRLFILREADTKIIQDGRPVEEEASDATRRTSD
jgi:hypothetical protein